jgi:hypothetical protein
MVFAPLDICLDGTALRVDYNIFYEKSIKNLPLTQINKDDCRLPNKKAGPEETLLFLTPESLFFHCRLSTVCCLLYSAAPPLYPLPATRDTLLLVTDHWSLPQCGPQDPAPILPVNFVANPYPLWEQLTSS